MGTANPKVAKGHSKGYMTAILHLAPSTISGYNVCPMASSACAAMCLNTAGRGAMFAGHKIHSLTPEETVEAITQGVLSSRLHRARIARTKMFFEQREKFMIQLMREIEKFLRKAKRLNLTPVIRLNGTSDIRWENIPVHQYPNIFAAFPNIQFYDYTKLPNRRNLPKNYHLTFSLHEANENFALNALDNNMNVAVVFRNKNFPKTFMNRKVINGDESDLRFLDPTNVIVGLKAKGRARHDTTGFVKENAA